MIRKSQYRIGLMGIVHNLRKMAKREIENHNLSDYFIYKNQYNRITLLLEKYFRFNLTQNLENQNLKIAV